MVTSKDAIAIARAAAEAEGWPWQAPLHVRRQRKFMFFGPALWHITTNAMARGGSVRVTVDEISGQVRSKGLVRY